MSVFSCTIVAALMSWVNSKHLHFMIILIFGRGRIITVPDPVNKVDKGTPQCFYELALWQCSTYFWSSLINRNPRAASESVKSYRTNMFKVMGSMLRRSNGNLSFTVIVLFQYLCWSMLINPYMRLDRTEYEKSYMK